MSRASIRLIVALLSLEFVLVKQVVAIKLTYVLYILYFKLRYFVRKFIVIVVSITDRFFVLFTRSEELSDGIIVCIEVV